MVLWANGVGAVAAAAFTLPALGFAIAPIFKRQQWTWQAIGRPTDFTDTDYVTKVITITPGIGEAGNTIAYVRKRNPAIDTEPGDQYNHFVALSDRCMHLGCPVRYVQAAQRFICPCHGGVYDFRGMVAGGPPVRPLDRFYTRLNKTPVSSRSGRATRSTTSSSDSRRASRVSRSTESASICTRPVRHRQSPAALAEMPRIPAPPLPKVLQPRPKKPSESNGQVTTHPAPIETGITVVDWLDERTSMSGGLRWLLFRKVPRGINWAYTLGSATLFAFLSQAVTGVFLAMYYRPDASGGAYESIRNINDNVFLGQFVHGMHKWGASVMIILIFLHMGAGVLLRRLQVPARADVGDRRRAADPDAGDGLHRLPAAVRPARLLGDRSSASTSTPAARSSARSCRTSCSAARTSAPPRCRASTRSTCC